MGDSLEKRRFYMKKEMRLNNSILANHLRLEDSNKELVENLSKNQLEKKYEIDLSESGLPQTLQNYEFPVSPWPILFSRQLTAEFETIICTLQGLVRKSIHYYLKDRDNLGVNQLNFNSNDLHRFSELEQFFDLIFFRIDLLFCNGQIKLLEINSGTQFGGWQLGGVKDQFGKILHDNLSSRIKTEYTNVLSHLLKNLYQCTTRHCKTQSANLLILTHDLSYFQKIVSDITSIYKEVKPESVTENNVLWTSDLSQVDADQNGNLRFGSIKIDVVIDTGVAFDSELLIDLHIKRAIFLPSNPLYRVFGNKLNFALMHELQPAVHLSEDEIQFIQKYIPITYDCYGRGRKSVCYQGMNQPLNEVLNKFKDNFVVKITDSGSGDDVFVGKFQSSQKWTSVVTRAFEEPNWIAQEYAEPDQIYSSSSSGKIGLFRPVFGIFGNLNKYCGAFVRLGTNRNRRSKGVINSAKGANETVVFQVV